LDAIGGAFNARARQVLVALGAVLKEHMSEFIAAAIAAVLSNLGALFFAIGVAAAYVRIRRNPQLSGWDAIDIYWREITFWAIGLAFLYYGLLHAFFQALSSHDIGWQPSPFEFELGFAEIGIGVAAILSRTRSYDMRLAVTIIFGIFSLGAAAQHIYFIVCCGNMSPGNAGVILWFNDIILPLILFYLAWMARPSARI
jgi:hypothetical protein